MAGTVLYQMIRNHERFIEQLAKARAEFAEKTGGISTDVKNNTNNIQSEGSARIYRIDGTTANGKAKGVVITNGLKVLRK